MTKGLLLKRSKILQWRGLCRGVHPPEVMMHFPLFQISPPISEKFSDAKGNFSNFTFSQKIFDFHPQKFLMTVFHLFRENFYFSQYSFKFPPDFVKFTCFLHILCVFR